MQFKAQPVQVNGTHLTGFIDGATIRALEVRFPSGVMDGYYDPDAGYDGSPDIGFVDELGNEYHVYARYGCVHIGSNSNYEGSELLAQWLTEELAPLVRLERAINETLLSY